MVFRDSAKKTAVIFAVIVSPTLWCIHLTLSNGGKDNNRRNIPTVPYRNEEGIKSGVEKMMESSYTFENINSKKGMDYLSRIETRCIDRTCSEFLTNTDKPHFKYCIKKTWKTMAKKFSEPLHSTCTFINGSQMYPMGLASYPGSGNTWVRGMLQKVTGLCTGAIYCDITLRQNGFPGESIRSGVTFLVKSHQTDPRWEGVEYNQQAPYTYFKHLRDVPVYSGGVFIMRNPFHAMVAEFQRKVWAMSQNNHIKILGKEHFGNNSKWNRFVLKECVIWKDTVLGWLLHNMGRPVILVTYEDFKANPKTMLEKILEFMHVPYSREQLNSVVNEGFIQYRRPQGAKFEHYTEIQKALVRDVVHDTARALKDLYLDFSSYLQP